MRQGYQEIYISLSDILERTLFSQCNWTAHEKYVQMEKGQKDKQWSKKLYTYSQILSSTSATKLHGVNSVAAEG